jgi:hypothetical protein
MPPEANLSGSASVPGRLPTGAGAGGGPPGDAADGRALSEGFVSRPLVAQLERDHGILINRKRVRRERQAMVQYLETALGLVPADGKPLPPRLERVR